MSTDPTQPLSPGRRCLIWLAGILAGDIAVGLQFAATIFLTDKLRFARQLGIPSMFLVPVLGGFIASYIWRTLKPSVGLIFLNTLWMTLLALLIGAIAFHEGFICLLILSPLYFLAVLTGALVGRILFRTDPTRLQLSILPFLAVMALAEPLTRVNKQNVVTDQILIRAPATKVWPEVKTFPQIPVAPGFWLFRLGLPYPVATTASGDFLDSDRQCIFSDKAIFKERVVDFVPFKKLTFDITESPPDPELIGHLTPHRGQFLLQTNADGTTTLTGSTWYTLHVRPLWYFDLWTHHIFRAVHLRVMEDIRRRAESSP